MYGRDKHHKSGRGKGGGKPPIPPGVLRTICIMKRLRWLNAGKRVFVEKPIALNRAQAFEMVELARRRLHAHLCRDRRHGRNHPF